MKKIGLFIGLIWLAALVQAAAAQSEGLQLRLRRNFGYSSGSSNDIQGTFTLTASGPAELQEVAFYIDDQEIGRVTQPPFELRFQTDSYPLGEHTLLAVGTTAAGVELRSNPIQVEFVSAEQGWQEGLRIVGPMFAIILGAVLVSFIVSFAGGKKLQSLPPGAPRQYGVAGGAICPRCERPYPRHVLAPNLLLGKLERCPFCGKWAIVAAASPERLRQAEAAEVDDAAEGQAQPVSAEDRLRKELDDSRYLDF
jgi:hypothetical protein